MIEQANKLIARLENIDRHQPWRLPVMIFLLALLLGLGSLNRGLQSDDYIHRNMLLDEQTRLAEKLNHFFAFLGPSENIPWWTQNELKIHFWRPFSALSHWLDYQLWPDSSMMMHAHNMLWYGALCLLVFALFRKLLPPGTAFLAALLFTLDFSHFANISWIANRNSLISTCFIVASLALYLHWRKHGKTIHYFLSLLTLCMALLSGEAGIVIPAVILLYEIYQRKDAFMKSSMKQPVSLAVYFVITALWYLSYQAYGFGTANNSMYFSPAEDITHSLMLMVMKIPVFLFSNLSGIDGFYNVFPEEIKWLISLACGVFVLLVYRLARTGQQSMLTNFLTLSATGVLAPVCLVAVLDMRLSLLSSVFTSALIAILIDNIVISKRSTLPSSETLKQALLTLLIVMHVAIAGTQWVHVGLRDAFRQVNSFNSLQSLRDEYPGSTLYILNHPSPIDAYYFPFVTEGESRIHILFPNFSNYTLSRLSPTLYELHTDKGFIFTNHDFSHYGLGEKPLMHGVYARTAFNGMLGRDFVFTEGATFHHAGLSIKIMQTTASGQASRIHLDFGNASKQALILFWNSQQKSFLPMEAALKNDRVLQVTNWTAW